MSTSLTKLLPNLSKEAEFGRGRKKIGGEIQQWHSRALNMRKLTQCGLLLWISVFAKYGEKFVNGQKTREGGVK